MICIVCRKDVEYKAGYSSDFYRSNGVCSKDCYGDLAVSAEPCKGCGSTSHITGSPVCNNFKGRRDDAGKPRVDLIPAEVLTELGKLYEYGARKYDENNWRKGMNYSRMYGSLMRHLLKFWSGEAMDEEGFHHLDAVIWGAVGLRYFELHPDAYKEFDDRWEDTGPSVLLDDRRQNNSRYGRRGADLGPPNDHDNRRHVVDRRKQNG